MLRKSKVEGEHMYAVCLATELEWSVVLKYYNIEEKDCIPYPYGVYFFLEDIDVIFFLTGKRKTNAGGAGQYMIDHFHPDRVFMIGSCAGIDTDYDVLDILIPYRAVQSDTTVWELDKLVREDLTSDLCLDGLKPGYKTGIIASSDKAVVMWEDYLRLKDNGITIADTESAAMAYVCRLNSVPCTVIRGISDFPSKLSIDEFDVENNIQITEYLRNTPRVIEMILRDHLGPLLKDHAGINS